MHIPALVVISYAFSVWMIVDAYKRGASHFWYLIIFFPLGEWVYFFLVKIHDYKFSIFSSHSRSRCATCQHCLAMDDDGVKCKATRRAIFHNWVNAGYCNGDGLN